MRRIDAALIDEERCIGCALCIEACPVDAIVGARGLMHTVVEPWCIGCKLCLPPCPVDCIEMVPRQGTWTAALRRAAGARAQKRRKRRAEKRVVAKSQDRQAVLAAALARKARS